MERSSADLQSGVRFERPQMYLRWGMSRDDFVNEYGGQGDPERYSSLSRSIRGALGLDEPDPSELALRDVLLWQIAGDLYPTFNGGKLNLISITGLRHNNELLCTDAACRLISNIVRVMPDTSANDGEQVYSWYVNGGEIHLSSSENALGLDMPVITLKAV